MRRIVRIPLPRPPSKLSIPGNELGYLVVLLDEIMVRANRISIITFKQGRYYRLAPSLLEKDRCSNWVVNQEYNPAMLAEALCKLEGFTYAPSETVP